jgi:hypothetical protein
MGKRLSHCRATCAGGMIIVSECLSQSLDSIRTINLNDYYYYYVGVQPNGTYTCEDCLSRIQDLRETVRAALNSISSASINHFYHHCIRILVVKRMTRRHLGIIYINIIVKICLNKVVGLCNRT